MPLRHSPQPEPGRPVQSQASFQPAEPSRSLSLTPDGLAGTTWKFGPADGSSTARITLSPEGGISGDADPRARFWSAENGALTFYDADGRPTVRFTDVGQDQSGATITGTDPASGGTGLGPAQPRRAGGGSRQHPCGAIRPADPGGSFRRTVDA